MASPRVLVQIILTGSRILGKALYEAGRQTVKNVKHRPHGVAGNEVAGMAHATSDSLTDQLTRQHRMTLEEAQLILNVRRSDHLEQIHKNYEHLFKANSPPGPSEKPTTSRNASIFVHSHYVQSKVVRARERLEAELALAESSIANVNSSTTSNHP
ncbi:hypothetical protein AMATHDRAFT_77694 [Amanita thiersii Skay4041]|uniref:Mitochondrial import inner membrane translocase subunit TIM16 n=1 Tax=Amanita thiersii Skay4041 TaxID=703135 RepID=A0A2A9NFG3_9AGAR|nr:hypothetical protein AMATHDRAFT_77694 [Amanita thiersii Skay4041]